MATRPEAAVLEDRGQCEVWRDAHIQSKAQSRKSLLPATLGEQTDQIDSIFSTLRLFPQYMPNLRYNPRVIEMHPSPFLHPFLLYTSSVPLNQPESFLRTPISGLGR